MATTTAEKPGRLLSSGCVQIIFATDELVQARVRGDSGPIWDVRWSRLDGWDCTCPAYGECTHRKAVAQVTMRPVARAAQDRAGGSGRHGSVESARSAHAERSTSGQRRFVGHGQSPDTQSRADLSPCESVEPAGGGFKGASTDCAPESQDRVNGNDDTEGALSAPLYQCRALGAPTLVRTIPSNMKGIRP
jgi:hypothetical protein